MLIIATGTTNNDNKSVDYIEHSARLKRQPPPPLRATISYKSLTEDSENYN